MAIALQMRSWKAVAACGMLTFVVAVRFDKLVEVKAKSLSSVAVTSEAQALVHVNGSGKVHDAESSTDTPSKKKPKSLRIVVTSIGGTTAQTSLSVNGELQDTPVAVKMENTGMNNDGKKALDSFFKKVQLDGGIDAIVFMSTWGFLMSPNSYNAKLQENFASFSSFLTDDTKPIMKVDAQAAEPGIQMEMFYAAKDFLNEYTARGKKKPAISAYAAAFLDLFESSGVVPRKVFLFKALKGKDVGPANGVAWRSWESHKDTIAVIFEAGSSQIKLCKIYLRVDSNGDFVTYGANIKLMTPDKKNPKLWTWNEGNVKKAQEVIQQVQDMAKKEGREVQYHLFVSGGHKSKRSTLEIEQIEPDLETRFEISEMEVHSDEGALEALSAMRGLKEVFKKMQ